VTTAPDGIVYQSVLALSESNAGTAIMVSHSSDGGLSWPVPVILKLDFGGAINDKDSITADPSDANYVYVVWDRYVGTKVACSQPVWLDRTIDGGSTWEAPSIIYDPGTNSATSCNQILALPTGTLVDVFALTVDLTATSSAYVAAIRSSDKGVTWSLPTIVSPLPDIGVVDVKNGESVRDGGCPYSAVDPNSGPIYTAWNDASFSGNLRDGIAFSKSADGGSFWSAPVELNQVPSVQAFNPAVAVAPNGNVSISYFDFRKDTKDVTALWTNYWRITSSDAGNSWRETPLTGSFNLLNAPVVQGPALFLGDYMGLAPSGGSFIAFFAITNGRVGTSSLFSTMGDFRGDASWNGHTEMNLRPKPPRRWKSIFQIGPRR